MHAKSSLPNAAGRVPSLLGSKLSSSTRALANRAEADAASAADAGQLFEGAAPVQLTGSFTGLRMNFWDIL